MPYAVKQRYFLRALMEDMTKNIGKKHAESMMKTIFDNSMISEDERIKSIKKNEKRFKKKIKK